MTDPTESVGPPLTLLPAQKGLVTSDNADASINGNLGYNETDARSYSRFLPMPSLSREDEIELAREILAGNMASFDRFVEGFRSRLFQYTFLVCGQRDDAEEVAQDALLKAFENLGQLREPEHVRAWVFRIARNACLMKRRKSVFAPTQQISLDELLPRHDPLESQSRLEIADTSELPDSQVLRAELRDALERAIRELPPIYKTVLLLRDVEELSTEETAQVLDVSADVVKTRLHRARLALRQELDGYLRGAAALCRELETAEQPAPMNPESRQRVLAACREAMAARLA